MEEIKEQNNRWGLSKKTNIAIAAIGGLAAVQQSEWAIIAMTIITLAAISYQFLIDIRKTKND
jgi:hypothetical protein